MRLTATDDTLVVRGGYRIIEAIREDGLAWAEYLEDQRTMG